MLNIHANDRTIPAGKVLLCDPRELPEGASRPERTVLDTRTAWSGNRTPTAVELVAVTAGWACAGSVLRWDNGHYAVLWTLRDGSQHGRRYRNLQDARDHFDRLPA